MNPALTPSAPPNKRLHVVAAMIFLMPSCLLAQTNPAPPSIVSANTTPVYAIATIKPNLSKDGRWKLQFTADGYTAHGVPLHKLIQEAYGVWEEDRILGEPDWVNALNFDVEAKVDDVDVQRYQGLNVEQRRRMLQTLLTERFHLTTHRENRERPIYALIIAKGGPHLQESTTANMRPGAVQGAFGHVLRGGPSTLSAEWFTMSEFAQYLSKIVGRHVADETGLTAHYNFTLDWTPDNDASLVVSASNRASAALDSSAPSIFTAIQEQLGLKLESQKAPVEVLVIDHVEKPSEN